MAKILLVDDDPITLKIVSFVLRAGGHQIATAPDGYAALEMLKSDRYQLVVSDVNMPGGFSGFRLASAMKEDGQLKKIPIVLVSVRNSKTDVDRARECGAEYYFVKPIQPDAFRAKVSEILARHTPSAHAGETPVREKGLWTALFQVTGVSERGLRLESPLPLPPGYEFCFASNIFHALGITTPQVRVISCEPSSHDEGSYTMKLEFAGLSEEDLKSVRTFVHTRAKSA